MLGTDSHLSQVLKYGDSPYVQNFGMQVEENPMEIKARVLKHPTLQYGVMRGKPTKVVRGQVLSGFSLVWLTSWFVFVFVEPC